MLRSIEVRSRTGCGLPVREGCCAFPSAKSEAIAVTVTIVRVMTIRTTLIWAGEKTKNAFNSFSSESSHRRCGWSTGFHLRLACREHRSPEFCLGLKPANPDLYDRHQCADRHRLEGFPGPPK